MSAVWLGVLAHSGFFVLSNSEATILESCCYFRHYLFTRLSKGTKLGGVEAKQQERTFIISSLLLSSKVYSSRSQNTCVHGSPEDFSPCLVNSSWVTWLSLAARVARKVVCLKKNEISTVIASGLVSEVRVFGAWNTYIASPGQDVSGEEIPHFQRCVHSLFKDLVLFWKKNECFDWRNFVLVTNRQNIWAGNLMWKHSGSRWFLKLWRCWDCSVRAHKTWETGRVQALEKTYFQRHLEAIDLWK